MIVLSILNNIILNCLEKEVLLQFFLLLLQNEEELKYTKALAFVKLPFWFFPPVFATFIKTKIIVLLKIFYP